MYLLEYSGKTLLSNYKVNIPRGYVVRNEEELINAECGLNYPLVLKAQVPTGYRGKGGGILFCENKNQLIKKYNQL